MGADDSRESSCDRTLIDDAQSESEKVTNFGKAITFSTNGFSNLSVISMYLPAYFAQQLSV